VRARAQSLPDVTLTATASAPPASEFNIEVRYVGSPPTQAQQDAFTAAADRWRQIILGDLAPVDFVTNPALPSSCHPGVNEVVDDVLIFAEIVPIDGPGGVLGQAGPCLIRTSNLLTVVGRMLFDQADVATLESNNRLREVILHEMAHVLGFGSLWSEHAVITGRGSADPFFHGPSARAAFLAAAVSGTSFSGNPVPVENSGGPGTRDVHWRESVLTIELMTGFLSGTTSNPLSAVSLASMRDLGYVVNDAVADPFAFQAALQAWPGAVEGAPAVQLVEAPLSGDILVVDRRGRVMRRVPRL
jgi:hypothetical protein